MKEFNLDAGDICTLENSQGYGLSDYSALMIGTDVEVLHTFKNSLDVSMALVEHEGGSCFAYRMEMLKKKQETMIVNGFEVVKGEVKPLEVECLYYVPSPSRLHFYLKSRWDSDSTDANRLERGLVHTTKENAIAHAKAMLGIDPNE